MGNPVNAFLQGFRAVDALETNRQAREFAREQQSRLRVMWDRQDEEYERLKLDNLRKEMAGLYNATLLGIHQEMANSIDLLEANGEMEKAEEARERWFTGPNAQTNWVNEANRRVMQVRPEFGELAALSAGLDPGAGPLIKNPSQPVSMVGVTNDGDMFVGVNALTGDNMPLTENRTASPTDPVAFRPTGLQTMHAMFGQHANNSELVALSALYSQLDPGFTGSPIPDGAPRPQATAGQVARGAAQEEVRTDGELPPPGERPEAVDPRYREHADLNARTNELMRERDRLEAQLEEEVAPISGFLTTGRVREPAIRARIDAINEEIRGMAVTRPQGDTFTDAETRGMGPSDLQEDNTRRGQTTFDPTYVDAIDRREIDQLAARGEAPPPEQLTADAPETNQEAQVPRPAPEEAENVARNLTNNQGTYQTPPPEEIFKAYMMVKAGVMSPEELIKFKRTGQFGPTVEYKLHNLGDGNYVITGNGLPVFEGRHRGAASEADAEAKRKAIEDRLESEEAEYDFAMKMFEPYYTDRDGDTDVRAQAMAARDANRLREHLGMEIGDRAFYDDFAQGTGLANNYFPGRFEHGGGGPLYVVMPGDRRLVNTNNIVGYAAVRNGVRSQRDFNDFGYWYGDRLAKIASRERWTPFGFIDQIERFEKERGSMSREEAVEQWIQERYGQ